MGKSNWYVITGAPSSGKTTVLEQIEKLGYCVMPEAARTLIDGDLKRGRTLSEIRANESEFQLRVTELKRQIEKELPCYETIFLDRAMPDSIAYYQLCGLNWQGLRSNCLRGFYQKVFLMEPLEFRADYARVESMESAMRLNELLRSAYENLGYKVVTVPTASVEDRTRFILNHM